MPSNSTTPPSSASRKIAAWVACVTAALLCVTRTAPIGRPARRTGTAVASKSSFRVALCRTSCVLWPLSAEAISGLEA